MTTTTSARPHGYVRYKKDACRCAICRREHKAYEYRRLSAVATGTWAPYVAAQPVRDHLLGLKKAGFGEAHIAELARTTKENIASLLGRKIRPHTRVRPETAQRILAIDPTKVDPLMVDSLGLIRRVQALTRLGWPISVQEREAGLAKGAIHQMFEQRQVRRAMADKIIAVYDLLSMKTPPVSVASARARNRADKQGWEPPLAWDEDALDDVRALPEVSPGDRTAQLKAWTVTYLTVQVRGLSRDELADLFDLTPAALKDRIRRARRFGFLPDTGETMARRISTTGCGTRAAYERHRRHGEPIDQACRDANRAYQQERFQRTAVAA